VQQCIYGERRRKIRENWNGRRNECVYESSTTGQTYTVFWLCPVSKNASASIGSEPILSGSLPRI
jgi:hypothetical protein